MPRDPQSNWLWAFRSYLAVSAFPHFGSCNCPSTLWNTNAWRELAFSVAHCTAGDLMNAAIALLASLTFLGERAWPSQRFWVASLTTIVVEIGYSVYKLDTPSIASG